MQRFVVLLLVAGVLAVIGLGLSAPRSTGPDPLTSAASPTPGAVQETPATAVAQTKLTPPTAPAAVVSAAPPPAPSADVSSRPEPASRSSQQLPLPTANPPAVSAPPAPMPAFDAAMNAVLAEGYPGGSLAVVRDGKLVYTRGYGFAKAGVAATPMTRYRQASVSKAVTGSLLAQLVTNGTLTMDLRVFPYLGVAPVDPRTNAITVRMLKDHTSGFAGDYFLFESRKAATFYGVASPPDPDTMVRWTAHYQLATDPGSTYHYNNTNYAILSRVIEKATGRAWIDLVRDMAKPFGIATWRLGTSLARPADEATYYEADTFKFGPSVFDSVPGTVETPYGAYDAASLNGAVALVSTVIDMARYDQGVAMGGIPAPELDAIPTKAGWSYTYVYNGSMPGQYTFVMRVWDGAHLTVMAGAFNHRDAGAIDETINGRILDAYRATTAWPAVDLFPSY